MSLIEIYLRNMLEFSNIIAIFASVIIAVYATYKFWFIKWSTKIEDESLNYNDIALLRWQSTTDIPIKYYTFLRSEIEREDEITN